MKQREALDLARSVEPPVSRAGKPSALLDTHVVDYMRPRCVELARVLKKTGSFYYRCDWHASHYVKLMLDRLFVNGGAQRRAAADFLLANPLLAVKLPRSL